MIHLAVWQWAVAVAGAVLVGVSKTGIGGLGLLAVVTFLQILPAKEATGVVLPLLICGDVVAVASYRRHTQWRFLWRLFPATAAGVVLGTFALGRIDDRQAKVLIGIIVLALLGLQSVRRYRKTDTEEEHGWWFASLFGVLAGFTTLVANAAGPLMVIYLLAMRLPKMEFVGTGAVFFLLLNLFKVPFMAHLGLVNGGSLAFDLWLVPAVLAGGWLGKRLLVRLDQRRFEGIALVLSAVAGVKLLF